MSSLMKFKKTQVTCRRAVVRAGRPVVQETCRGVSPFLLTLLTPAPPSTKNRAAS